MATSPTTNERELTRRLIVESGVALAKTSDRQLSGLIIVGLFVSSCLFALRIIWAPVLILVTVTIINGYFHWRKMTIYRLADELVFKATVADIEALSLIWHHLSGQHSEAAKRKLVELMPRVTSRDKDRIGKGGILQMNEMVRSTDHEIVHGCIHALWKVGDIASLHCLGAIMENRLITEWPYPTREYATRCVKSMWRRIREDQNGRDLLRASAAEDVPAELLRSVEKEQPEDPEVLLRPEKRS